MPSFYASYWSTDPHKCLIGGVKESQTSRFEREQDAQARLDQIIDLTPHATGEVLKSNMPPEIFSHCPGSVPQAIGGRCFACGKVLTAHDASMPKKKTITFSALVTLTVEVNEGETVDLVELKNYLAEAVQLDIDVEKYGSFDGGDVGGIEIDWDRLDGTHSTGP